MRFWLCQRYHDNQGEVQPNHCKMYICFVVCMLRMCELHFFFYFEISAKGTIFNDVIWLISSYTHEMLS